MSCVGSFFFREDVHGLSVLNAGIPAYSARISSEQLRHRRASVGKRATDPPRPLAIHWFGPRPANEQELIAELWIAVDEFVRTRTGTPDGREDRQSDGNRHVTAAGTLDEDPNRISMSHSYGPGRPILSDTTSASQPR
jgi:hypothetical protein